ncbi:MAG TPA: hypothetical protein VGG98_05090 [Solirubrobacteraceae bacterium]|jgi:hypothetical protein
MSNEHPVRSRLTFGFLGAGAFYLLLELVEKQLAVFDLRLEVQAFVSVTVGALGVLLNQIRESRAANNTRAEQVAALDSGMASFTPQLIGEPNAQDLGVNPHGDTLGQYIERDIDKELADTFREVGSVVVVGPRGCGKTRTALQCLAEYPRYVLLVPENAAGLSAMISDLNRDALFRVVKNADGAVLWLDDLERFLPELDLDQLDRFQRPGLVRAAPSTWRSLWERVTFWRDATEDTDAPSLNLPDVRLLATLNQDRLETLANSAANAETADAARTGRRLLARTRGIHLADELTAEEQTRFAGHGQTSTHTPVSSIFPLEPNVDWQASVSWERKAATASSLKVNLVTVGLALFTIAVAAATVFVGQHLEWTVPPSTAAQVKDIEGTLEPCQKGIASSYKDLREGQLFTLIVDSSACPGADELRYYRYTHERLKELFAEAPRAGSGSWSVSCIGPGTTSQCEFAVGHGQLVAAAFREPTRGQLLPLLIYPSGHSDGNAPRLRIPFLPKPPRVKDPDAAIERHLRTLALRPGAPVDVAASGKNPCPRGALCGYPAEALVALPADHHQHPALLSAGYLASGPPEAPTRLRVEAWEITVPHRGKLAIGKEPCLILDNGLLDTTARVRPKETPHAALLQLLSNESIGVVC